VLDEDSRDLGVLEDLAPALPRPGGERLRHVDGVHLAVLRQEDTADRALEVVVRHALGDLARRDDLDLEAEALRHRRAALQLLEPPFGEGDGDRAVLLEAGRLAGLFLQPFEEARRVLGKLGEVAARPELADEAGRVPRRPRSELLAFEEHRVPDADPGEVIGDGRADDAAADDDDIGAGRKTLGHEKARGCGGRRASLPASLMVFQPVLRSPAWRGPARTG